MSELTKFYIKSFLLLGLGFATTMVVMDILFGDPVSVFEFFFHAVFFGGTMTLFFAPDQIRSLKKLGVKQITPENLSVRQERSVVSSLNMDMLKERLLNSSDFRKMKMTEQNNEVRFVSRFSWDLWGNVTSIKIKPLESGINEYSIVSYPRNPAQKFDSGQNFKIVTLIERILGNVNETVETV